MNRTGTGEQSGTIATVATEAALLQNGYALAVDSRDWDHFRTLFAPDVVAVYPHGRFDGVDAWLDNFVPIHDEYAWSLHVMSTHVTGEDEHGFWATCYGRIQWIHQDRPTLLNRGEVVYRDRLRQDAGQWLIAQRRLDMVMREPEVPIPPTAGYPAAVAELGDRGPI
ncbi:hypothetical protein FB384_004571 [Prauserella sediminis]|uniref:SnoaL-like domain-containing protein n=1 Tax=Prauserella sediminis TaxID=577680 RepID=A0A839XYX2_9PSEU|nr:nuclear transport factor 2 family protein [Prauserella sediminis]MBB3665613.1 hypothetical protein [Prauserella sediminis]